MSIYRMDVLVGGRTGKLRIEITDLPGTEKWQCMPANIIGWHQGRVFWRGAQLGLFSEGAGGGGAAQGSAYAVLDIPPGGLDEVPIGEGDEIRITSSGVGRWVLTERIIRP